VAIDECAYGKTVWSRPSSLRSSFRGGVSEPNRADGIDQSAGRGRPEGIRLLGEHGISRQPTAQGRPCVRLHLYAAVHFSLRYKRTADRGCQVGTRPSLRPLFEEGARDEAKLGRDAPRGCEGVFAIEVRVGGRCRRPLLRHCEEPLRRSNPDCRLGEILDCFASLAMTNGESANVSVVLAFARTSVVGSEPTLPVGSRTPAVRTDARPARS